MADERIDLEQIRAIAHLARLRLADDEVEPMRRDINAILGYVDKLNELDTTGVEPMTHVAVERTPMRADEVREQRVIERALGGAPEVSDGSFVVPKVVE